MKIGITAPVFITNEEHRRHLDLCTRSIFSSAHDVAWIPVENHVAARFRPVQYVFAQEPANVEVIEGGEPQSVSAAWNRGIECAASMGCTYVLAVNIDAVLKSNLIDRLVAFAEERSEAVLWTASEHGDLESLEMSVETETFSEYPNFGCFLVRAGFIENFGRFDENCVPIYFEDADMRARLALAGERAYRYQGAHFYHFGSLTIRSDLARRRAHGQTFPKNRRYFLEKWGHPALAEVTAMRRLYYPTPYNEPGRPLSYWRTSDEWRSGEPTETALTAADGSP